MRSRNIKPGFFKNEYLAVCGPEAMICFAGLWCMADRRGILEDRPMRIKAELFPYFSWNPDEILSRLSTAGFIVRYEAEGRKLIWIPKFLNHQNPVKHETKSAFLMPDNTSIELVQNLYKTSIEQVGLIPDSFNLIPDILIPDILIPEKEVKQPCTAEAIQEVCSKPISQKAKAPVGKDFEEWWKHYPRKENKKKAEQVWNKISNKPVLEVMLSTLSWQCKTDQWQKDNGQYIPMPTTYINGEKWNDQGIVNIKHGDPNREVQAPWGETISGEEYDLLFNTGSMSDIVDTTHGFMKREELITFRSHSYNLYGKNEA